MLKLWLFFLLFVITNNLFGASSDFDYLKGYNLTTNINAVYIDVNLNSFPNMTNYEVCQLKTTINFFKKYICLPKYDSLSIKKFKTKNDYAKYGIDIYENNYIVQGLTTHRNGNFLITAYFKTYDDNSYEKPSIVINYNPDTDEIVKIYELNPENFNNQHVGGIGFHFIKYPSTINPQISLCYDMIFISETGSPNNNNIVIFQMTETELNFIKKVKVETAPSYLSISNGYLWFGNWKLKENNATIPLYLEGIKITATYHYGVLNLSLGKGVDSSTGNIIPNIRVDIDKADLQGVYCDSNPDTDKRLNFFFTASGNRTFVYQATLNIKDIDNDGKIGNDNEWYWESFFTPHDPRATSIKQLLPDGGEGIVKRGDNLYMVNEGASKYYYAKWTCDFSNFAFDPINETIQCIGTGTQWVDGAREILMIDPIISNGANIRMFNNGSLYLQGTGNISDFGHKVVLFLAQNKRGEFYYSWGEYMYRDGAHFRDVYFNRVPSYRKYPTGFQQPFNQIHPTVAVEDIKAIYIMNLDEENDEGDSDNWNLDLIDIIFDDTEFIGNVQYMYDVVFDFNNHYLGNNGSVTESGIVIAFNTIHSKTDKIKTQRVASDFNIFGLNTLRDMLNDCYLQYGNACLINPMYYTNILEYFENTSLCALLNHGYFNINYSSLNRINNITSSLCE